jgi:hypothetical protein
MTTINDYARLHIAVIQLSVAEDGAATPSEILEAAEARQLVSKIIETGGRVGVDVSSAQRFHEEGLWTDLEDALESWANVADPEGSYGFRSDGPHGWSFLCWGIMEHVAIYAGDADVTWNR